MANLPNKPFVFNYNARDYNPSTFTIPKTSGQTMDRDMVWTATTSSIRDQIAFDEDHISVPLSAYSLFDFSTVNENPMNNLPSSPAMTIIVKFKTTDISKGSNLICNRDLATYNWMARVGANSSRVLTLHTLNGNTGASESVSYTQSSVITAVWRVNTDRKIEIKNLTEGTSNTPFTSAWQAETPGRCKWCLRHQEQNMSVQVEKLDHNMARLTIFSRSISCAILGRKQNSSPPRRNSATMRS